VRNIGLGLTDGALTYVGRIHTPIAGTSPGARLHSLLDRRRGDLLSVYIELFRGPGEPMPVYVVIVGRLVHYPPQAQ
jgi:hypothetical protein